MVKFFVKGMWNLLHYTIKGKRWLYDYCKSGYPSKLKHLIWSTHSLHRILCPKVLSSYPPKDSSLG